MSSSISRREALKSLMTGAGVWVLPLAQASPIPSMKPHVRITDPVAASYGYSEDASKVNVKAYPTYQSGQVCSNCTQLTGRTDDAWRPCYLFPGKLVAADGWCTAYKKKG